MFNGDGTFRPDEKLTQRRAENVIWRILSWHGTTRGEAPPVEPVYPVSAAVRFEPADGEARGCVIPAI